MGDRRELIRLEGVLVQARVDGETSLPVDWTLDEGEFWVVGGLNGSGKSPWLSTTAGLYPPNGGRQMIFGQDIREMAERDRAALRAKIGFVFENTGRLFAELNVVENVALPLSYQRNCPAEDVLPEVQRVLDACGLSEHAASEPNTLGRGIQRRVALARALVLEPELLMVDSPLTSQDPMQTRWWVDFLTLMHRAEHNFKTPRTIVVTTEDFGPWLAENRRFALLDGGEFQVLGDYNDVAVHTRPVVRDMLTGRSA